MESVSLSSKGQFVLPKSIRDRHHWGTGTRLVVIDRGDEVIVKAAVPFAPTELEAPDANPVYHGKCLSLADMDRAIAHEAAKHK